MAGRKHRGYKHKPSITELQSCWIYDYIHVRKIIFNGMFLKSKNASDNKVCDRVGELYKYQGHSTITRELR